MTAVHELQTGSTVPIDVSDDDSLLTVHDTARLLTVSVTWYTNTSPDIEDRLPFVKLGKYLRFDRRDLQAYVHAKRAESRRQPRGR